VLKGSDFGGQMVQSHLPSPKHKEHLQSSTASTLSPTPAQWGAVLLPMDTVQSVALITHAHLALKLKKE
jgi:hypothetical protein